jgi:uncharacterized protein YciU (UPF0263 family)
VTKVHTFDFDIEYVKGKKNIVADALFRRPAACSLIKVSTDWKSHLLVEYSKNKFACEVLDGPVQDDRYMVIDDVIFTFLSSLSSSIVVSGKSLCITHNKSSSSRVT